MDNKNVEHKLTLTEGQIGIILCSLEDSINKSDYTRSEENQILQPFDSYCQEVDTIFEILEGVVDEYYETKVEKAGEKNNAVTPTINGISVNLANGALKDYYAKLTSGET
tara:strand:+ start:25 stop:354 length:330 start_codon:yes stop_codon:yes gene_type:complete